MMDPFVLFLVVLALIVLWVMSELFTFRRHVAARVRRENDLKRRMDELNRRQGR